MSEHIDKTTDKQFGLSALSEEDLAPNPFKQFDLWYGAAEQAQPIHPNAFTLATVSPDGAPSARMLLLKGLDDRGFVFYTNKDSRKGSDINSNPMAAICFWWDRLERQVRIEGIIEEVSGEEADTYFNSRPQGSRIGAWASPQSRVIESRKELEEKVREMEEKYKDTRVPRPPYWTGYRLIPSSIEFWQGRPNRLHDRIRYNLLGDGQWFIERLAP